MYAFAQYATGSSLAGWLVRVMAAVPVSASACVRVHACVLGRSYAMVGGGYENIASGS